VTVSHDDDCTCDECFERDTGIGAGGTRVQRLPSGRFLWNASDDQGSYAELNDVGGFSLEEGPDGVRRAVVELTIASTAAGEAVTIRLSSNQAHALQYSLKAWKALAWHAERQQNWIRRPLGTAEPS
jgi:hypothetical protein